MTGDSEERPFVGTDGKEVKLKHSRTLKTTPWYAKDQIETSPSSTYEAKRDVYEDYDPETYKAVIQSFVKKKHKKRKNDIAKDAKESLIYDSYSRTTQTESCRDRRDTAHYLKSLDPFGDLEFEENDETGGATEASAVSVNARGEQDAGPMQSGTGNAAASTAAGSPRPCSDGNEEKKRLQ